MSNTSTERRPEMPELDRTNLGKAINTSQRTVQERRSGVSKSNQSTKFKKSARVRATTINCGSSNFQKIVKEFTEIPSLNGSPISSADSSPTKRKMMPPGTEQVRVAPASNLDVQPEDGYNWTMYRQRTSLEAKYPRNCYWCTHKFDHGCLATKQVQRSGDDPTVFQITYRGTHTCINHPAAVVPPPLPENQTDSNASIDAAPLQMTQPQTQSQENHNSSSSVSNFSPASDNISSVMSNNINFSSTPDFVSPSTCGTDCFSESPARLDGFQVGIPGSELAMTVSADKKRNDSQATRQWTERVQLDPSSNLVCPLDGFSWKKYGQKDIPGAKYPWGYYRCIHRNVRGCLATKKVQRSDDDPTVFEITYRGRHTCIDHPAAVVPPSSLPENQTDSNASIDDAPFQIRELPVYVSAATSGNNSQAPGHQGRLPEFKVVYHRRKSDNNEMQRLVEEKSISDQPVASSVDTSISLGSGLCSRAAEDKKELKPFLGMDWLHTKAGYVTNKGSLLHNVKEEENVAVSSEVEKLVAMQKRRAESDFLPMQSTRDAKTELFPSSDDAEDQKELKPFFGVDWLHTKAGYVTNKGSLLHDLKEEENAMVSSESEKLVAMQKHKAESDFVPMQSTRDTKTELFPSSHDAEDQKELKPFSGMDWLHTKEGCVMNKGSLLSDLKEEENVMVSSEAEKLVAMQKQRADSDFVPMQSTQDTNIELFTSSHAAEDQKELKPLLGSDLLHTRAGYVMNEGSLLSDLKNEENVMGSSDFVPMQSTRDTDTELFPWMMKKDVDPHAALGKLHWHSSHSESEFGSHCVESESEDTDEKMKIRASPEYHRRETLETAVLEMRNTAEPEVERFFLEVNEDTASDKVHSYSSEQESEVDSYCSGPEYEVGDKKARIEASPGYNDIIHIPKMKKESSSHTTLDDADALIDMLGGGGKQEGRSSEGWGAIKYDSIVDHLIKSIKKSNIEKIGIYGRNEVAKAIVIEALKESAILRNLFDRVICATVPLNCDMEKVQKEIAGQISSDLTEANVVDMPHSVVNALEGLKFLLILVGVNQRMKLETLRIPEATPPVGSKIVFVTGSGQLCDEIEVDKKICLDDLLLCELFRQNVGEVVYYSKKALAREIVRMCRPYSHAVILVARALQNVDDILIWKRALERLNVRPTSHEAGIEALMVNVLRFCIDQLEDDKTRRCLKNLALCNNYHEIASESAIGLWIRNGIVDAHDEGQRVLKNLVNASLLEVDENRQFLKFQDQDQDILVNLIFQPEENRVFLMRGGLDLIEPPEVEEWESAKEICLMHTAISELPKEPRCPSLSSLYLQRNYKLRKLSSSFFNQMPALEVLNLSRTRIRCLPESISQLISLKRLFLNDCVLLRSISPAIARLKRLEVFDLEGTKIKNLPREIECLINLTCLGISISGTEPLSDSETMIPHGVISSLLHLEELNLDVDANAEWWDTCAEGVLSEVCNLKRLSTFKFSFPTLELLRQFNQLRKSMEHPSLAQFRLCVGNHASRIMNRLPSDIEFELEQCNRFLRYTNGDGVFTDIKDILQQSDAFFLERHANLKKLSELGIDSMDQLKWCVLGECNELEVLMDASDTLHQEALTESHCKSICLESLEFLYVYYMRNLRNIWKGSMQKGCLSSLKLLTLCKCPELTIIFSSEMLDNLNNLEEVTVEDCPAIKSLITCQTSTGKVSETSYFLPILKKLSLHYVPKLSNISCGLRIAPRLERLSFYDCSSLKSLSTDEVSSEHMKKIRGERSWWEDLKWHGHKPDHLDSIFVPIDTCDIP